MGESHCSETRAGKATPAWGCYVQSVCFLLCRDTFIVTLGNAITSILAGFAIFSVLGYMSQELGVPVNQVAKAGEVKQGPVFPESLPGHKQGAGKGRCGADLSFPVAPSAGMGEMGNFHPTQARGRKAAEDVSVRDGTAGLVGQEREGGRLLPAM